VPQHNPTLTDGRAEGDCSTLALCKNVEEVVSTTSKAESSMGPNSGGGKRNKTKATPARARFSNFFPHAKSQPKGKESETQNRERKKYSVPKTGLSASVAGAFDRVSQSLLASADEFHVSSQVADHVISLLSRSNEDFSESSDSGDDEIDSAAPVQAIEKAIEQRLELSTVHDRTLKTSRDGLSDSESCALQLVAAYGFTKDHFINISELVGNDMIDICAAAVLRSCGIDLTTFQQLTPSSILEEELITIGSIYGEFFSVQRSSNGCILCQLTYEASNASAILAIQFADLYPSNQCNVAAWLYCPTINQTQCMAHCRDALKSVRERCTSGLPIMFDVFQTLEEVSSSPLPVETQCHGELQQIYDKYKFTPGFSHPSDAATIRHLEATCAEPFVAPSSGTKSSSVPETKPMSGIDTVCSSSLPFECIQSMRIQYNKALNWADESGFAAADASQKAKERLCGMFPQYSEETILAALHGKSSELMKPSTAFNIQLFDFGVQLQCTKSIMKSVDVTKGKAKSLLSQAIQQIVEDGGKIFASSMDEAKQLLVDLSISLYEEQNLARRKQQSESYLHRHGIAARTSSVADTFGHVQSVVDHPVIADSAQATVRTKFEDLVVPQVSKLFSEQQCVDAVRLHSDRLQQQSMPGEKTEIELRKESQLSRRLCDELQSRYQSNRYKQMLVSRQQLPAFQQQEKIISDIGNNRVTLVIGDTGLFCRGAWYARKLDGLQVVARRPKFLKY
jgi:hypothetical protein